MKGDDSPWLTMLFPEVPEVQRHDDGCPTGNRGGKNVPVVLLVCHAGNQWPMARHLRIAKVRKKLALEIGGKHGRPSQLGFQHFRVADESTAPTSSIS